MNAQTKTIETKFDEFKNAMIKDIHAKANEFAAENREKLFQQGVKSLFNTLSDIENMEVTKTNADTIIKMFKLIDTFENAPDSYTNKWDMVRITQAGVGLGFDESMSLSIYYMTRYAKAYTELSSKKLDLYKIVTGVN